MDKKTEVVKKVVDTMMAHCRLAIREKLPITPEESESIKLIFKHGLALILVYYAVENDPQLESWYYANIIHDNPQLWKIPRG